MKQPAPPDPRNAPPDHRGGQSGGTPEGQATREPELPSRAEGGDIGNEAAQHGGGVMVPTPQEGDGAAGDGGASSYGTGSDDPGYDPAWNQGEQS
jgi:hypothetical protein